MSSSLGEGWQLLKILFGIALAILVAGSVVADYKWRRWIEKRRRDRQ